MSITVIKEGDQLRILSATEPIPENTPIKLFRPVLDPWQAAQLETTFRTDEDWGDSLEALMAREDKND